MGQTNKELNEKVALLEEKLLTMKGIITKQAIKIRSQAKELSAFEEADIEDLMRGTSQTKGAFSPPQFAQGGAVIGGIGRRAEQRLTNKEMLVEAKRKGKTPSFFNPISKPIKERKYNNFFKNNFKS